MFVTGGAKGADLEWAKTASSHGLPCKVLSFPKHRTAGFKDLDNTEVIRLENLEEHSELLRLTSLDLHRDLFGASDYVLKLLLRNIAIASESSAVIGVGFLESEEKVAGGTAWACHAARLQGKQAFLYQQKYCRFGEPGLYKRMPGSEKWVKAHIADIPFVEGDDAIGVVGTRELDESGEGFIRRYFELNIDF